MTLLPLFLLYDDIETICSTILLLYPKYIVHPKEKVVFIYEMGIILDLISWISLVLVILKEQENFYGWYMFHFSNFPFRLTLP